MCSVFDNEEVGSGTKQGAGSTFGADVLKYNVAQKYTTDARSPINTLLLSQSIFKLPLISTGPPAGSFRFDVRLMMALILAFTSKMLNGFVI